VKTGGGKSRGENNITLPLGKLVRNRLVKRGFVRLVAFQKRTVSEQSLEGEEAGAFFAQNPRNLKKWYRTLAWKAKRGGEGIICQSTGLKRKGFAKKVVEELR